LVLDVPAILAQMHGDAVGAAEMRLNRGPDGIGLVRAPRLPDRCDMVDIDAKFNHGAIPFHPPMPAGPARRAGSRRRAARDNGRGRLASAASPPLPWRRRDNGARLTRVASCPARSAAVLRVKVTSAAVRDRTRNGNGSPDPPARPCRIP